MILPCVYIVRGKFIKDEKERAFCLFSQRIESVQFLFDLLVYMTIVRFSFVLERIILKLRFVNSLQPESLLTNEKN